MKERVCLSACETYQYEKIRAVLKEQFAALAVRELIKPGALAVLKPNLLARAAPDSAIVTHPLVTAAAASLLKDLGARVLVAESPGGPYTLGALKGIYKACGYAEMAQAYGVELNLDCSFSDFKAPNGRRSKLFPIIAPIQNADLIVDLAKMKTHCMTGMSGAVKNLFGTVPGLMKPELHCRFPQKEEFAEMLVDLCESLAPRLCVVDAVTAMEGNGPSGGNPRFVGALISSRSPYAADVLAARLMGISAGDIPMLKNAVDRGLCPGSAEQLDIVGGPVEQFVVPDFLEPESKSGDFLDRLPKFLRPAAAKIATPVPKIRTKDCIGCGKCAQSCPQHTIRVVDGKAQIQYGNCIRCYCCHEMCPIHVIDIKRFRLFHW